MLALAYAVGGEAAREAERLLRSRRAAQRRDVSAGVGGMPLFLRPVTPLTFRPRCRLLPAMAHETLTVDNDGPRSPLVTLRRDKALNALNRQLLAELDEVLSSLTDKGVRAAVLTGAGDKAFVAGADIAEMSDLGPAEARTFAENGHRIGDLIASLPIPVIAAVNGFALGGGCELALACDFIYASEKAKFGQPEVNLGLIPGFGGTQRFLRRIGPARAAELVLTADMISAEEALRIGLVNAVVPAAELLPRACNGAGAEDREQGAARHRRRQARAAARRGAFTLGGQRARARALRRALRHRRSKRRHARVRREARGTVDGSIDGARAH